jgi:hypothetical protein
VDWKARLEMLAPTFVLTAPRRFGRPQVGRTAKVCCAVPTPSRRTPLRSGTDIREEPTTPSPLQAFTRPVSAVASLAAAFAAPREAGAVSAATAIAGPLFAPLNADTPEWVRTLVWADFRVAVALFVIAPFALFLWSFNSDTAKTDAVKRVMVGYWQSSSLLLLTVLLNISNVSAAAFTGLFVQALVVVSLTWWADLLVEIEDDDGALSKAFRAWRCPAIVAAAGGVAIQLPFQGCNFTRNPHANPICSAWLEPPTRFHELLIPGLDTQLLSSLAFAGCSIYGLYLVWLCLVVLPKVGRQGRKDRNCFSSVSALKYFGLIDRKSPGN